MLLYIMGYYSWIVSWQSNETIQTWGGNIFSLAGIAISGIWLLKTSKKSRGNERVFWLLLALGTLCYLIADGIWFIVESLMGEAVSYPGSPDFFYILQLIFFLGAFVYKLITGHHKREFIGFLFDILIVMSVAATFSWYFIMEPIIEFGAASSFELMVSLAYPIGDLGLLLAVVFLYFRAPTKTQNKTMPLIFLGFLIQVSADTLYLYLVSIDQYSSASLIDPLFIVVMLIIGFSGLIYQIEESGNSGLHKEKSLALKKISFIRILTPYVGVIILFGFMGSRSSGVDIITIGAGVSIFLVIIRQILTINENQRLLIKYYAKAEDLEISEERYRSLFEYHPDSVYSTDLNGRFESVNAAYGKLLGYEKEELIGLPSISFVHPEHHQRSLLHVEKVLNGASQNYEISVHPRAGGSLQMNITNIPIIVRNNIVGIFGIGKDITENKRNEERITHMAFHDSLTDLANRALFEKVLKKAVTEAGINKEIFAVLFIDLNRFKQVNDTLGHNIGDMLLISVATRLKKAVNKEDTVARQGGDEFTLLIKNIDDYGGALLAIQKIQDILDRPHYIDNYEIISTPSIGIALYPLDAQNANDLMKKADSTMYRAKEQSRGK